MPAAPFAYVFERFPSFTQTFCAREVLELQRLGMRPLVFSIHDTREEAIRHFPRALVEQVVFLPHGEALVNEVKQLKDANRLSKEAVLTLRHWGNRPDKRRVQEACWIGVRLQEAGVHHAHAHFGGLAARTCWWLRQFFGITFSFTGHANDILCPDIFEVSRERLMADASAVVTVSDFMSRHLVAAFPAVRHKVHRVYNGLDLAPIGRVASNVGKVQPPLVVSVGRLIPKKGFEDLVRACGRLRDHGIVFQCEIIGEGERREAIEDLVARLQLGAHLRLAGARSIEEVTRRLGEASVMALACVTEPDGGMDNLPTVIMEAMAAGLPCVSTRLAGIPEMVVDGETGLLVDEHDWGGMADAISSLLSDTAQAQRMGKAGALRAQRLFAKETTARHLRRVLVGGGRVGWHPAWLGDDPLLAGALARQALLRARLLLGLGKPTAQGLAPG